MTGGENIDKEKAMGFVETFETFNRVVESAFGQNLSSTYKKDIEIFSTNYRKLSIFVPLKVIEYGT